MNKIAASSKFYLPPVLLFLAFLFMPPTLWALMGFNPKALVSTISAVAGYRLASTQQP